MTRCQSRDCIAYMFTLKSVRLDSLLLQFVICMFYSWYSRSQAPNLQPSKAQNVVSLTIVINSWDTVNPAQKVFKIPSIIMLHSIKQPICLLKSLFLISKYKRQCSSVRILRTVSQHSFFFFLDVFCHACSLENLPAENNCVYVGLISDFVIFMRSAIFLRNC